MDSILKKLDRKQIIKCKKVKDAKGKVGFKITEQGERTFFTVLYRRDILQLMSELAGIAKGID